MGIWGTGLFECDLACDMREAWAHLFRATPTPEEATAELSRDYEPAAGDADDGPVFWLTLAELQWRYGCLDETVKRRALGIIEAGEGLDQWREAGETMVRARMRVYEKLRAKITGPARPLRKIRRFTPEHTPFEPGQLLRLDGDGRSHLLLVCSHYKYMACRLPLCLAFEWRDGRDPTQKELAKLKPLADEMCFFNRRFMRDQLDQGPPHPGLLEFMGVIGDCTAVAPRGSHEKLLPAGSLRVIPGDWNYPLEDHRPNGPTVPFWNELAENLQSYREVGEGD